MQTNKKIASTFINLSENIYFMRIFACYVKLNESSAKASCDILNMTNLRWLSFNETIRP